jgi:hypothetical protein
MSPAANTLAQQAVAEEKADSSRVARAALAGFQLVKLADGTWLASRWGMFRGLADTNEVERFLTVVGAPA